MSGAAQILDPTGRAKTIARWVAAGLAVVVVLAAAATAVQLMSDPFGLKARHLAAVETQAVVNGQQAASEHAGAVINDSRAANVAKIQKTGQEARNAVAQNADADASIGDYLTGLDRVRVDGAASITTVDPDGR